MVSWVGTRISKAKERKKYKDKALGHCYFATVASPFTNVSLEFALTKTANLAMKNIKPENTFNICHQMSTWTNFRALCCASTSVWCSVCLDPASEESHF